MSYDVKLFWTVVAWTLIVAGLMYYLVGCGPVPPGAVTRYHIGEVVHTWHGEARVNAIGVKGDCGNIYYEIEYLGDVTGPTSVDEGWLTASESVRDAE